MTNSQLFKQAHTMTKQVIKKGDCYKTTFGLCLKAIKDKQANKQVTSSNFLMLLAIVFVMFINKATKASRAVFKAENIAGAMIILPIAFMFAYFLAVIIAYSPTY